MDAELKTYNQLTGKFKHYCYEWDYMAIDESCEEFIFCSCNWGTQQEEVTTIQEHWQEDDAP